MKKKSKQSKKGTVYRTFINKPTNKRFGNSKAKRRESSVKNESSSKPSQKDIKKSLKGEPKGSSAFVMKQKGNKWEKVGKTERK